MNLPVLPLHLGALHPHEQLLVVALAFGPFLALGLLVAVRGRQQRRGDATGAAGDQRER